MEAVLPPKEVHTTSAIKIPRHGALFAKPKITRLKIVAGSLYWLSKKKPSSAKVPLDAVLRVMEGQHTKNFERFKKTFGNEHKSRSVSLIYNHDHTEEALDIVFDSDDEFQKFKGVVETEITKAVQMFRDPDAKNLQRLWEKADLNLDGSLCKAEVTLLVKHLNVSLDARYISEVFSEIDVDNSNSLDFDEFVVFMKRLRQRPELSSMWPCLLNGDWEGLAAPTTGFRVPVTITSPPGVRGEDHLKVLPLANFHTFLTKIQGENSTTLAQAKCILLEFAPENRGDSISFHKFACYLNNPANTVMDPKKAKIYMDMSQPLNRYFIASSHNTYLEGDQLNSASSVNRYINDLMNGCRCVELDCWDGSEGEPLVYHGHTLTGRILFKDIIQAVAKYAFRASEYPVILSLENHCKILQQEKMAKYLKQYLGNKLAHPPTPSSPGKPMLVPSPQALRMKVIIKGKRLLTKTELPDGILVTPSSSVMSDDEDEDFDEDGMDTSLSKASLSLSKSQTDSSSTVAPGETVRSSTDDKKKSSNGKKHKRIKVAQELSDITWMPGVHFKGWDAPQDPVNCTSYVEKKMERYLAKHPTEWIELNKRMFTRIYPGGLRVDSSNYNPVGPWFAGCQIVALNLQTPGVPMQLNKGKFLENGNCGYVLKPAALREAGQMFHPVDGPFPSPMEFTLTVISGQQLPKPRGAKVGELIDPYVVVDIVGVPGDLRTEITSTVDDNGFNPVWNATYTFTLKAPELALINFTVWDKDLHSSDDYIASVAFPVTCLRPGFRKVPLNNFAGAKAGDFEYASLFVYIHIH